MSKLERFQVGGQQVFVEVEDLRSDEGFARVGVGDGREDRDFGTALARVKPAADRLVTMLNELVRPPDEYEVQFGLKFNAGVGAIIAKTSTEANFSIKLKWTPKKGA
jgi:hypothetical protein